MLISCRVARCGFCTRFVEPLGEARRAEGPPGLIALRQRDEVPLGRKERRVQRQARPPGRAHTIIIDAEEGRAVGRVEREVEEEEQVFQRLGEEVRIHAVVEAVRVGL